MKERVEFAVDACVPGWQASVWEASIEDEWSDVDHLHFLRVRASLRNRGIQHAVIIVLK